MSCPEWKEEEGKKKRITTAIVQQQKTERVERGARLSSRNEKRSPRRRATGVNVLLIESLLV